MAWRFEAGEGLRDAFRRVASEEIAKVRAALTDPKKDGSKAVHESRQSFKRLRALLRLAEPSLGRAFAAENRRWRDAGRKLAGSRDRTVLLESFDKVAAACGDTVAPALLARLRGCLADRAAGATDADAAANVHSVLETLDEADRRVASLRWPNDAKALAKGLAHSQARLRKKWKAAKKSDDPHALHEWRKRVKDQAAQLRLLRGVMPPAFEARHGSEKAAAEMLGLDHDLWMLQERLSDETLPGEFSEARGALLDALRPRRVALREEALSLGKGFSAQGPKAFARELTAAWQSPRPSRGRKGAAAGRAISRQP